MPVCGTDGKTYGNDCLLQVEICLLKKRAKKLSKAHEGPCKDVTAVDSQKEEGCPSLCMMVHMPVCGTDGQTYGNDCQLQVEICLKRRDGRELAKAYEGSCRDETALERRKEEDSSRSDLHLLSRRRSSLQVLHGQIPEWPARMSLQ